jgi:CRISPR-associated protein (TIGR03986 family)
MNQSNQVHAPYHFVPLSKWVYMPDWAHLVSHDVPFKDGYSGVLEYTLSNATPLCVGGEQEKEIGKPTRVKWAVDPHNNPVIPSSSLKGMVRSVLEIATFGKFAAIDDGHFSYREVSSKSHYLENVIKQNNTVAAWLKYDAAKQGWILQSCQFAKIKHVEANRILGLGLKNSQTAIEKYQQHELAQTVDIEVFTKESKTQGLVNWVKDIGTGSTPAHMVFCNKRILGSRTAKPEDYEFSYCFYGPYKAIKMDTSALNTLANSLFESHEPEQVAFLQKNQHRELGIPVFALVGKKDNKVTSIGLAKMPRVLYKHAASELGQLQQGNARNSEHYFDMAELMFGTLREKALGLKSRVFFSDATLTSENTMFTSNGVILNGPKATFKAAYLEQPVAGQYQDYDADKTRLAGWKRYITSEQFTENAENSDKVNVQSTLELLKPQSQFSGKIVFHNLKPEELGALVWSLQLGDLEQSKQTYHGLGHGKSLGAGAVQIHLKPAELRVNSVGSTEQDLQFFVHAFKRHMQAKYPASNQLDWVSCPQIQHLQAMANMQANQDRELSYHQLEEFKGIKNNKLSLAPIEVDGEALNRTESNLVGQTGALSFGQGRLAALFADGDQGDTWLSNEKAKQKSLQGQLALAQQLAEQESQAKTEAEELAKLPEEYTWIAQLRASLNKSQNIHDRRLHNGDVEALLERVEGQTIAKDAALQLYTLINDKSVCEYLAIKDKKKLKPRKAKVSELASTYDLQVGY